MRCAGRPSMCGVSVCVWLTIGLKTPRLSHTGAGQWTTFYAAAAAATAASTTTATHVVTSYFCSLLIINRCFYYCDCCCCCFDRHATQLNSKHKRQLEGSMRCGSDSARGSAEWGGAVKQSLQRRRRRRPDIHLLIIFMLWATAQTNAYTRCFYTYVTRHKLYIFRWLISFSLLFGWLADCTLCCC